jgi:hypothetical protein
LRIEFRDVAIEATEVFKKAVYKAWS